MQCDLIAHVGIAGLRSLILLAHATVVASDSATKVDAFEYDNRLASKATNYFHGPHYIVVATLANEDSGPRLDLSYVADFVEHEAVGAVEAAFCILVQREVDAVVLV